jgi:uncharacterized membrane protein (DUF4010 family)
MGLGVFKRKVTSEDLIQATVFFIMMLFLAPMLAEALVR